MGTLITLLVGVVLGIFIEYRLKPAETYVFKNKDEE